MPSVGGVLEVNLSGGEVESPRRVAIVRLGIVAWWWWRGSVGRLRSVSLGIGQGSTQRFHERDVAIRRDLRTGG